MEKGAFEDQDLITVREAASEASVSTDAIRKAIYRKQLPSLQIYGRLLIKREDFHAWMNDENLRKKGPKGPRKVTAA
jgi:excisionase family DNA binding protein